jgi:thioredoxin 1
MKKVLMFSASWCNPCRQAKPVFNQLKESVQHVEFQVVDVDENPVMATNFGISGVPTFVIMEGDKEVQRVVGGANVMKLKEIL